MNMQLQSLNLSKPIMVEYKGKPVQTGIFKEPVSGKIWLSQMQLEGDGQADLINHGGADKAVCVYAAEHYAHWENRLERKLEYGAFGENFTVSGLLEAEVHIGDTFEIGDTVVQITQPRQPCFKLGVKHNLPKLPQLVQDSGYTGYYFRVLKQGHVATGEAFRLVERHPQGITVAEANRLKYNDKADFPGIRKLLGVDALSDGWRRSFEQRLSADQV
jgi:MOSC domain-containing protein YiiM